MGLSSLESYRQRVVWSQDGISGLSSLFDKSGNLPRQEAPMIQGERIGVPMSVEQLSDTVVTNSVTTIYDSIAQTFQETRVEHQDWFSERAQFLLGVANTEYGGLGNRVLEIGCGTGSMVDYLVDQGIGKEIVGLDISPKMIAIAQSRHLSPNPTGIIIDYKLGNAREVSNLFEHSSFDSVISMFADIHIYAFRKALRARYEVLKPGGNMFIMVPTNDRFLEYMENAEQRNGTHPENWWERKRALLNSQGFLWLKEVFPEMAAVLGAHAEGVPTLFMLEEQWMIELEKAGFADVGVHKPEVTSGGYPRYMVLAGVAEK